MDLTKLPLRPTVTARLTVLTAFLLSTFAITVLTTVHTLEDQKSDASVINIAGRQRMLSQKFTKELLDDLGRVRDGEMPTNSTGKTQDLFEVSQAALLDGGETFTDLGMKEPVTLPAAKSPDIRAKLEEAGAQWNELQDAAGAIRAESPESLAYPQLLDRIRSLNVEVLKTMNTAVVMLSTESSGKVVGMMRGQWTLLLLALTAGTAAGVLMSRTIAGPLRRVVAATQSVARGEIEATAEGLPLRERSEVGDLARSTRAMIDVLVDVKDELALMEQAACDGRLSHRCDADRFEGAWRDILSGMNQVVDAFVEPIDTTADAVDRISRGDIPEPITREYRGDFNRIKDSVNRCIAAMQALVSESTGLIAKAQAGDLSHRCNTERLEEGAWRDLVTGMNTVVGSFVAPIDVIAKYLDQISNGEIPEPIEDEYLGDLNRIKESANKCVFAMMGILTESNGLITAAQSGDLSYRGDVSRLSGGWAELIEGMNSIMEAVATPIRETAARFDRISRGDIPEPSTNTYFGDFDEMNESVNRCIAAMKGLLAESGDLIDAARSGRLDRRGDASRFEGSWANLIEGMNGIVEAFAEPIDATADRLDRISRGEIPERITREYRGDFNRMKDSVNRCIDAMNGLVEQSGRLIAATREGRLDERGDPDAFEGSWADLIRGMNDVLEAVVGPLQETARVMSAMSEGVLYENVRGSYQGAYRDLQVAVNSSVSNLWQLVDQIVSAADAIASGAGEIADASQDLSDRTQSQAAALEEAASTTEQITSAVRLNADHSGQAKQLSADARSLAEKGGEVVGQAITGMAEIAKSSERIAEILGTIDSIAFQTNLLALNASVEAARAGEAGRGFAVVAAEVRNLALRSAEASREIKTLIHDSEAKVEKGTKLIHRSGDTLEEIVNAARKVNDLITEIAAASAEQATGVEQVNIAVGKMDEGTQQNAAMVEQASAAAASMRSEAQGLTRLVGTFRLAADDRDGGATDGSRAGTPERGSEAAGTPDRAAWAAGARL